MKLLLSLASPEYTGPAELMIEDARTLAEAGHEVSVAFDTRRAGSLRERVEALGLPIEEDLDLCRIARPLPFARDVLHLRRQLRAGRYDTLHCRFAHDHHVALLALAGLDRGRFRLLRSCELLANVGPGEGRGLAYGSTDAFALPSVEHRELLHRHHGVAHERLHLLPGRVDTDFFSPGASGLRGELGIPAEAPVVGIVSRIKPDRLHLALIAAFSLALRELPQAWLVIVGRGEGEAEIREAAARAGIGARTRFAGYRSGAALADAYRAFDVKAWLAPGNDGTCRAVLEAMASGCAVLGGRFGAVAEAVVEGETGRLCDPADPAQTAAALVWMLSNRERSRALGAAGRALVEARYTPARRAAELLALYRSAWEKEPALPSHRLGGPLSARSRAPERPRSP